MLPPLVFETLLENFSVFLLLFPHCLQFFRAVFRADLNKEFLFPIRNMIRIAKRFQMGSPPGLYTPELTRF